MVCSKLAFQTMILLTICVSSTFAQNDAPTVRTVAEIDTVVSKIAFGSCGHQDHDQPILNTIVAAKPDVFIYLGDNIYGDTKDMEVLKAKYNTLGSKKEFHKGRSKDVFMKFWNVSANSPRREHPGIYGSHYFADKERTVQILLLDTRTFRDFLKRNPRDLPEGSPFKHSYQPDPAPEKTMLGERQWKWLLSELKKPADLRVICSSIQFGHEYNGYESWTNLPLEQQKMVQTIRDAKANGVVWHDRSRLVGRRSSGQLADHQCGWSGSQLAQCAAFRFAVSQRQVT